MQSQRIATALGTLAVIAVGLLLGPADFGPGEQSAEAALLSEVKKLLASDAQAGDFFGISVAVSGDTAVVGAYLEDAGGGSAGAAYVFQRDQGGAGNWGQVTKLTASDAQPGDQFGRSVAISGDTALVGAWQEDAGGGLAGAAYLFGRDEGGADNWGEVKKLLASDAEFGDEFGRSVAVSGDSAVVGAPQTFLGGAGAAYVFGRDEGGAGNWGEVKKLVASDAQTGDLFGGSVAVSGDTAVVGARTEDAGGSDAGAAYVFGRDEGGAGNWGAVTKLTASDAQASDLFGASVAVSSETAVVGAFQEDAGGSQAGAAYVFGRDEGGAGNWGEVKKLLASDAQPGDLFGWSVAVSGDTAVVGAPREDAGGSDAGAAYILGRDEGGAGNWGEVTKLTASDAQAGDLFGGSVAVSGDTAVVGARFETAGGLDAGAAYVFEEPLPTPTPTPCPPEGCPTATLTPTPTSSPTITPTPIGCEMPSWDWDLVNCFGTQSLWHHETSASISGMTGGMLAFNQGCTGPGVDGCTFATGAAVAGRTTSPTFDASTGAILTFKTARSTENLCELFDHTLVLSSTDGGASYAPLDLLAGGITPGGQFLAAGGEICGESLTAQTVTVALSAGTTNIAFDFDSEDDILNDFPGQFIDDVTLTACPPEGCPTPTPTPTPEPGVDSDNDGCTDVQELGPNPSLGGQRDPNNFWDFFDVPVGGLPRNQAVDAFDIGAVVLRFGAFVDPPPTKEEALAQALMPPADATSYHAAYDRGGPIPGQNLWNLLPPNGPIDAFDIGAVVVQFGHTCVAPP